MLQGSGIKNHFIYFCVGILLVFSFQNCSDAAKFEDRPQNQRGTLYGNGSGHEGKLAIPIDYVSDVSQSVSYQPNINFDSIVSSNDGHLDDVLYYCRSVDAAPENGLDFVLTKPAQRISRPQYVADLQSPGPVAGLSLVRSTSAKAWNSSGVLTDYPANTARQNVIGPNGHQGLLLEPASTNVLLHSQNFLDASWNLVRANIAQHTSENDPENLGRAYVLNEGTFTDYHYVEQNTTLTPSTNYVLSVFIKEIQAGRGFSVRFYNLQGNDYRCSYDFSSGAISVNGRADITDCQATTHANGWVRLSVTANSGTVSGPVLSRIKLELYNPSLNSGRYPGSNHSGVLLWGAQLEAMASPTSYIATTTGPASRDRDQLQIDHSSTPITDGYFRLNHSLLQTTSTLAVGVSNGVSENVNINITSGDIQSTMSGQSANRSFAQNDWDQGLSLKINANKYTLFAQGQFVTEPIVSLGALGTVTLSSNNGGVLLKGFQSMNKSPINEVVAVSSLTDLQASQSYGVLVLGRQQSSAAERVQTLALPLSEDQDLGILYNSQHDLFLQQQTSLPGLIEIRGTLEDGTIIDNTLQCHRTNAR